MKKLINDTHELYKYGVGEKIVKAIQLADISGKEEFKSLLREKVNLRTNSILLKDGDYGYNLNGEINYGVQCYWDDISIRDLILFDRNFKLEIKLDNDNLSRIECHNTTPDRYGLRDFTATFYKERPCVCSLYSSYTTGFSLTKGLVYRTLHFGEDGKLTDKDYKDCYLSTMSEYSAFMFNLMRRKSILENFLTNVKNYGR